MAHPLLAVQGLYKAFRLHLIDGRSISPLQEVSFAVAPQEHFLIYGRSGIGKTTILKCIYRSYLATAGQIWFASQRFGRIDLVEADESSILQLR